MSRPKHLDEQFEEYTLQREPIQTETGWILTLDPAWSVAIDWRPEWPAPKLGSLVRVYGGGLGFRVRGMDLDGQELYYRTPEQEEERCRQAVHQYNRDR